MKKVGGEIIRILRDIYGGAECDHRMARRLILKWARKKYKRRGDESRKL